MCLSVIEHTQCCISLCSWALKGEIQLFFINLFINDEGMRVFCAMQCDQSGQNEKGKCRRQHLNRNTDSLLGELLVGAKENVPWSPGANGFALFLPPPDSYNLVGATASAWAVAEEGQMAGEMIILKLFYVLQARENGLGHPLPDGTAHGSH